MTATVARRRPTASAATRRAPRASRPQGAEANRVTNGATRPLTRSSSGPGRTSQAVDRSRPARAGTGSATVGTRPARTRTDSRPARTPSPGRRGPAAVNKPLVINLPKIDLGRIRARSRLRWAIAAVCLTLVFGFFAVAFAQAELVVNQQELDTMRAEITEAKKEKARLAQAVDEASSPLSIVKRAGDLGMVRAVDPVYLVAVGPVPELADESDEPVQNDDLDLLAAPALSAPRQTRTSILSEQPGAVVTSPLAGSQVVTDGTRGE